MRKDISIALGETDRQRLEALVADRNTSRKHVWRWQARFMVEGVPGVLRDKTRPPGAAPPADAVVLSLDEKSRIQALDRTQSCLPLKKGRGSSMAQFSALTSLPAKSAFFLVRATGRIWFSTGLVSGSSVPSSKLRPPSFDPVGRTKADEGPAPGSVRQSVADTLSQPGFLRDA